MRLVDRSDQILYASVPLFEGDPASLRETSKQMLQLMTAPGNERGIGMAAPQVGLAMRMFVMLDGTRGFKNALTCINPEVLASMSAPTDFTEGCLTVPGYRRVARPDRILAAYTDLRGQRIEREFKGLSARVFQHELDHLNGVTIFGPAHG